MFTVVVSVIAWTICLGLGLTTYATPLDNPYPIYVLFAGIFITFIPAVITHPARHMSGGHVNVGWRDIFRSAPLWAILFFGASVVIAIAFFYPFTTDSFSMDRAAFRARPERYRMVMGFFMVFFSSSALVRASGLRASGAMFAP